MLLFGFLVDRSALKGLASWRGWLLFLAVCLPWFILVYFSMDQATIQALIEKDIAGKISGESRNSAFYKYILVLLGSFAPWILIVFYKRPSKLIKIIRSSNLESYFTVCFLVPLVIMSCIGEKHGKYILPLFPCVAAFLAMQLTDFYKNKIAPLTGQSRRIFWITAVVLVAGNFFFYIFLVPKIYSHRFIALPSVAAKAHEVGQGYPLYSFQKTQIQLVYYYKEPIPVLDMPHLKDKLAQGQTFLIVADDRSWPHLDEAGLCVKGEWPVFLKRNRQGRLYGTGELCNGQGVTP